MLIFHQHCSRSIYLFNDEESLLCPPMGFFTFFEMALQNSTFWGLRTQRAVTLKFKLGRDFLTMHLPAKFHHPTFNHLEVTVVTKKTNTQTRGHSWKHPPSFAMLRRWRMNTYLTTQRQLQGKAMAHRTLCPSSPWMKDSSSLGTHNQYHITGVSANTQHCNETDMVASCCHRDLYRKTQFFMPVLQCQYLGLSHAIKSKPLTW